MSTSLSSFGARHLPHGRTLPAADWQRRHRALVTLLWIHVVGLTAFALAQGVEPAHAMLEGALVAAFALAASGGGQRRQRLRSTACALGLITCSAVLVHLWEGHIEAHFHFFVVISLLSLYEDWLSFGLAFAYVVAEHGVMSAIAPASVYNHADAIAHPWTWALIHGIFVAAAGVSGVIAWRLNEVTRSRMNHQALHDPLTGLPNRTLFSDRLTLALARSRREATVDAILFLDLDGFKVVNDSLGHQTGDAILLEVARRLDALVRADDTVSRFGGDEFTLLATGLRSENAALDVAARVADAVRLPIPIGPREIALSASIGVVVARGGENGEDLLRDADAAMYRAKERGRARVELFDDKLRERVTRRLETENDLRLAIGRGELRTHYQPKVSLASGDMVGFEALVRWQHPRRGLVPPDEFIPLAEETGLVVALGEWVLRDACRQAAVWRERLGPPAPFTMSVNLSRRQLEQADLLDVVERILEETGLPPAWLCLEITESAVMRDLDTSIATLVALKRLGVRLAIDDFGVGFSSLSQLKRLPPVDMLKIDKSFVDGITESDDRAIVAAILSLAGALGVETIAEGVEHAEQVAQLSSMGCQLAQGFHFARPAPPEQLETQFARLFDLTRVG